MAVSTELSTLEGADLSRLAPAALFDLTDRVAVVTGAGGGLGSWLCAGLAAARARAGLRPPERVHGQARPDHRGRRRSISTAPQDLREPDAADRIADAAVQQFGRLDVVVNNAGVNRREPIFDVSGETWDLISRINLRVPYELSRAAARIMASNGTGGSIVHIASLNNAIGLEGVSVYGAHKAALCQLAKSMAIEWTPYSIRVNALCPGFMLTPLSKPLWDDPIRGRWIRRRSLLRRPGKPGELIGCCLLLASSAGSFITGQTYYVDGGWLAGTPWDDSDIDSDA